MTGLIILKYAVYSANAIKQNTWFNRPARQCWFSFLHDRELNLCHSPSVCAGNGFMFLLALNHTHQDHNGTQSALLPKPARLDHLLNSICFLWQTKRNDKAATEWRLMHCFRSPVHFLSDALPPKSGPKRKLVFISHRGLSCLPSAFMFWFWGQKFDSALIPRDALIGEKSHVPWKFFVLEAKHTNEISTLNLQELPLHSRTVLESVTDEYMSRK